MMYHDMWFDKEGRPLDHESFGRLFDDMDYRRVGSTDVGPYWVSTVWLGTNHRWTGEGPPIIFETMVFAKSQRDDPGEYPGLTDIDCQRYCTEAEALAGHEEMVTLVRATYQEDPPCKECGGEIDQNDPHAGYGMCAGCLHDALRSGWSPGDQ